VEQGFQTCVATLRFLPLLSADSASFASERCSSHAIRKAINSHASVVLEPSPYEGLSRSCASDLLGHGHCFYIFATEHRHPSAVS
jgi:hypothetical protein